MTLPSGAASHEQALEWVAHRLEVFELVRMRTDRVGRQRCEWSSASPSETRSTVRGVGIAAKLRRTSRRSGLEY